MEELILSAGDLSMRVLPGLGGRVASLSFQGVELFTGPSVHAENFGSTYWTSPQEAWGWPPIPEIDHRPYEVLERNPLKLRGSVAELAGQQVRLTKRYSALPELDAFETRFELENLSAKPLGAAGWQISRVHPGGLTFFPTGERELTPVLPHGHLSLGHENGMSFFDHKGFSKGQSQKVNADGRLGFLAHLIRQPSRPILLLKVFEDSGPEEQAPGEGEVEIFANEDGAYVEIEVQGRLEQVPPGGTQSFSVLWAASFLPSEFKSERATPELFELARGLAARLAAGLRSSPQL